MIMLLKSHISSGKILRNTTNKVNVSAIEKNEFVYKRQSN